MVEVAAGIPVRGDKVLLGLRSPHKRVFPGCWDLIGGHVEKGETPVSAFLRETEEEIGIVPTAYRSCGELIVPDGECISARLYVYRVDAWVGEPRLANAEHSRLDWFDLAALSQIPNLASDLYLAMFASLLAPADLPRPG